MTSSIPIVNRFKNDFGDMALIVNRVASIIAPTKTPLAIIIKILTNCSLTVIQTIYGGSLLITHSLRHHIVEVLHCPLELIIPYQHLNVQFSIPHRE